MSNKWFQFKQFLITQDRSALKVGTDGVLLGAWCGNDIRVSYGPQTQKILDVGTGTGLIALMLAQRTNARVTAIEINEDACTDASNNFRQSPWKDQLELYLMDFNEYSRIETGKFDLIVSNPPYFKQSLKSADYAVSLARHDVTLSFEQLIDGAKNLLNAEGRLAVILPYETFDDFRETARLAGFYLARKTSVIPKVGRAPKRVLLEFSVRQVYPQTDELVILMEDGRYSDQFSKLTGEFYLNGL